MINLYRINMEKVSTNQNELNWNGDSNFFLEVFVFVDAFLDSKQK